MKLTRKELYELVWEEPMTIICKQFGLSDNGLRKHCKAMNIPTPSSGYWSRLKYGYKVEKTPLPKESNEKKQEVILSEVKSEDMKVDLAPQLSREKLREQEISKDDTSAFVVPEILYVKDPLIMDTKEKLRQNQDNNYLKKNPYTNKIKSSLNIYVSEKSIDRALNIFSTIIKALRSRGHSIKTTEHSTYAVVQGEEIQIEITEKKKWDPESINQRDPHNFIYSGELHFNIIRHFSWDKIIFKDTVHTRLEDKIISIMANLEVLSERIIEDRIEQERRRIREEEEKRRQDELKKRREKEYKEFVSLFSAAERLFKTNILRQYIHTYEMLLKEHDQWDEQSKDQLNWAKDKADWLDPFLEKKDELMDYYNKDEILKPKCPKETYSWNDNYSSSSSGGYNFWNSPYRWFNKT